jgi:hypothetical protein
MKELLPFVFVVALAGCETGRERPTLLSHSPFPPRSHNCDANPHVDYPPPTSWNRNATCEDGIWFEETIAGPITSDAERAWVKAQYREVIAQIPSEFWHTTCSPMATDPVAAFNRAGSCSGWAGAPTMSCYEPCTGRQWTAPNHPIKP